MIHYISLDSAINFLRKIFVKFESSITEFVFKKINEKAKIKKKAKIVDSAFVLRIVLEFYKMEKIRRFKMLKKLFYSFSSIPDHKDFSLSFEGNILKYKI